jgi:hypothetical protein
MPLQPAVLGTARLNNFRLDYLTPALEAERPAHVRIIIGGIDVTTPTAPSRVIYKSVQIRDVLFDAPNTCALTLYGAAPSIGAPIEVWVDSNAPVLLFSGELQTIARSYKGRPTTVLHPVTAIDDTARANRKRPLLRFVNVSATTIAQTLITTYAPGFSTAGVEANLPLVSITFDGSEAGMKGCLTALAKLIGGYWFFENKTLYFFITPPGNPPDPIDDTPGRFLHEPQITWSADKSQVRTRVYGKGASTQIATNLDAGTTLIPLENGEMFNAVGGQAIAAAVPDGAAYRVLTYTGVQLGGGGGLVGPGATPSAAPGLTIVDGSGIESGVHKYAYTFTTASGESLPSPIGAVTVGPLAPPAAAPNPGAVAPGGSIETGTYHYALSFVTAAGETTVGPVSPPVSTDANVGAHYVTPPSAITALRNEIPQQSWSDAWNIGDHLYYVAVYVTAAGLTTAGGKSPTVTATSAQIGSGPGAGRPNPMLIDGISSSADPAVTGKRLYRNRNGSWQGYFNVSASAFSFYDTGLQDGTGAPPATNTAYVPGASYQAVTLYGLALGPVNVTARRLYRYTAAVGWRLLATIPNNTATSYGDSASTASLSGTIPSANTALANWVRVAFAVGGSGVTGRKIYRSKANVDPLQLAYTIADNTTATLNDNNPDAGLGAAPPVSDTSGLTQPSGQVPAGSTSIIVANTTPFPTTGGWAVIGNGEQVIRYTGKSATALTGIPATGSGSIVAGISYNSTITAAPALVGVTGLTDAVIRNSPIFVWVQRDDLAAQSYMALVVDGHGDGVYEHIWSDERRSEASLVQVCDAQLELYSRLMVSVTYASRDTKTKSGKTVAVTLATPAITETLTIQDVTITELGVPGLKPKFTVTASNVHHSFDAVLRMLLRKADA